MDGAAAADREPRLLLLRRLSDPAQPELLVDVRRHSDLHARRADRHRRRAGDALHAACRLRLQLRRIDHARRQLRLAVALPACQWRGVLLRRRLRPHRTWHVLRLLQGAARGLVDPRRHSVPVDGGHRLHGLRAALGPDECLGRHRHHQPVLGAARRRRADRHLAVGWLRRRQSDAQSLLFAALPVAVRDRRRGRAAHLGAAYGRAEQSDRRRAEDREGHLGVHALCDRQGQLLHGRVLPVLRLVRVLPAELSRPFRQLHHGQSGPDADPYRAGMVLPAVLRHPARDPEQAPRRYRAGELDHHSRLPALARHLAGAFGELPAAVPAISADLLRRRDRPWLSRLARAVGRLCDRGAHPHRLLFRLLPHHPAAARIARDDQAAAEFDLGSGVVGAAGRQGLAEADMISHRIITAFALAASLAATAMQTASAEDAPPRQKWSFSGPFGIYDQAQLQRGFKIYKEVCSTCHSIKLLAFRNLADPGGPGFTEAQAATIASSFQVTDGPNDKGEMFQRPGKLADHFPPPFPNDQAARSAMGGGLPPDMSVLAKARGYEAGFPWFIFDAFTQYQEDGPDYIHAILVGYEDAPAGVALPPGSQYNKYFPGHAIAMPKPLSDGQVEYTDGAPATVDQYAKDISAFLMWAAEPKLDERKRLGFQVFVFLIVLTGLLYFTKKKVWHDVHHPETT